MKRIIRIFIIEIASLYIITAMVSGIVFQNGFKDLALAGALLTLAQFLVKPVLNLLLLPLNLVTFGLFRWISGALILYLLDLVIPQITVNYFSFPGLLTEVATIPDFYIANPFSYILYSLTLSLVGSFLFWLVG